jgi:hypothetical protein
LSPKDEQRLLLPPKNLLLAVGFPRCDPADFKDIAQRIERIAPDIHVKVFHPYRFSELPDSIWKTPTLLINLMLSEALKLPRGAALLSRQISKLLQDEMFRLGGIHSPKTAKFEIGMELNPEYWGDFVLMKPMPFHLMSKGQSIQVFRTRRLSGMSAEDFPSDHLIHSTPMLIQQFVDSGDFPQKYRALTLCGDVLYIAKDTCGTQRPDSSATDDEIESGIFHANGASIEYGQYPEIHEFARKMATAFPSIPLLGCDIIRDVHTGELFALEVNAGGNVWHFSSKMMAESRNRKPEVLKRVHEQYGAFDVAAKALIRTTRRMAM